MMRYISFIFMLGFSQILLAVEVYEPGKITFSENGVSYKGKHLFKIDGEALDAFHQLVQEAQKKNENVIFLGEFFPDTVISEQEFIDQNFVLKPPSSLALKRKKLFALHLVPMEAEKMDPDKAREETQADIDQYFTDGLAANQLAALALAIVVTATSRVTSPSF